MLLRYFLFSLFSNPPLIVQNLQRAPFLLEANAIAEASAHLFLFNMRSRDSALSKSNLGSCTYVFWWDDVTPLFEYSLQNGDGQWQKYLAMNLTNFQYPTTASPGETQGHAVLCYGYDSIGTQAHICMGWGNSFPDKWININSISGRAGIYVVSLNAEEGARALETKALEVTESY